MAPMDMALVALVSCLSIPAPAAAFGPARPPPTPPTPPLVGFSLTPFANCSEGGVDDGSSICYESDEESKLTVLKTLDPAVCKHTLLRPGNCTLYAYPKAKGTVIGLDVQKYTQSSGGHLWFYSVNPEYRPPQCGEVDAGLRIPAELFEAKNKAALDLYSKVTLAGYGGPGLTLGRCSDTFYPPNCNDACAKGSSHRCRDCENGPDTPFSTYSGGLRNVPWMTPDIGLSCKKLCNCSVTSAFDPCMDVPDDPGRGRFCSLCGPKYTRAITLTLYVQPQPPAPPPAPECNPDKGCTVCAACCQAYIKDGNDCNACVQQTCANNTIADIAIATPDLTTLVAALKAGDLIPTLEGAGPFTVFTPSNEGFAALPAGTVSNLLKPQNKPQLVDILTYHVVPGNVQAKDLKDGQVVKTVEGKTLTVRIVGKDVFINSAKVTTANVEASNGVVHVIDEVLLPSA